MVSHKFNWKKQVLESGEDCPPFAESAERNADCPLLPAGFVRRTRDKEQFCTNRPLTSLHPQSIFVQTPPPLRQLHDGHCAPYKEGTALMLSSRKPTVKLSRRSEDLQILEFRQRVRTAQLEPFI